MSHKQTVNIGLLLLLFDITEYDQGREFIENDLTFDKSTDVNLFEITIRVLGGLLSAYALTGDTLYKHKAVSW